MSVPGQPSESERVISPCVGICRLDDKGEYCIGCLRTLPEIAAWAGAGEEFKRAVWRELPERRRRLNGNIP